MSACHGDKQALFTQGSGSGLKVCDTTGTWATFVEVGVGWHSGTIRPGAGTVRQWILSHRQVTTAGVEDEAHVCGIGAQGVDLGSPWFSTIDIPTVMPPVTSEWTGVKFSSALFDLGKTPAVTLSSTVTSADPKKAALGDQFTSSPSPFQLGVEGLDSAMTQWPDIPTMRTMVVDHDGDGKPGLTGDPFTGHVEGEAAEVMFSNPRLAVANDSPRTNKLYLALRTRASLNGKLVSCDPPRYVGKVVGSTLVIEVRNVGCVVADTGADCTDADAQWIDANLPQFVFNGTSNVVSVKVADDATCEEVRTIHFSSN